MVWSYFCKFLQAELTVIPTILNTFLGKYDNTFFNGVTWLLAFWYFVHIIFDYFITIFTRKFGCHHHIEIKLKLSLWNLIVYSTILVYSISILYDNNIELFTVKLKFDNATNTSRKHFWGFIMLITVVLHNAIWDLLKRFCGRPASRYAGLFLYFCFSYYLGFFESSFKITTAVCNAQVALELTRCWKLLTKNLIFSNFLTKIFFIYTIFSSVLVYIYIVCVLQENTSFPSENFTNVLFSLILLFWIFLDISNNSVVLKLILHCLSHDPDKKTCNGNLLDCCLFSQRDDTSYVFGTFRKAMKERRERSLAMRKPKNNNRMVFQTLKCMAAIKKKFADKRKLALKTAEARDTGVGRDNIEKNNENEVIDEDQANIEKIKES